MKTPPTNTVQAKDCYDPADYVMVHKDQYARIRELEAERDDWRQKYWDAEKSRMEACNRWYDAEKARIDALPTANRGAVVERYNCPPMSDQKPEPDGCMVYASDYDAIMREREDYMLKQKVWEGANDELRSAHIRDTQRIRELEAALLIVKNLICGPRIGTPEYSAMLHIERVMRCSAPSAAAEPQS